VHGQDSRQTSTERGVLAWSRGADRAMAEIAG
jgi:hypothetical protein